MALDNKTERLQVTLPSSTLKMIDDVRQQGGTKSRSAFLNEAARIHAVRLKKARLIKTLKTGYLARARRDRELVNEWEAASAELLWDNPANSEQT